jgi:hypothetical protein
MPARMILEKLFVVTGRPISLFPAGLSGTLALQIVGLRPAIMVGQSARLNVELHHKRRGRFRFVNGVEALRARAPSFSRGPKLQSRPA